MKQAKLLFLLIAALAFDSCRPTAQQTVADAESKDLGVLTFFLHILNDIGELPSQPFTLIRFQEGK